DGPGKATLQMARTLTGRDSPAPTPVDITWQGGMQFDGQTVVVQNKVTATSADDTLHCDRLSAKLARPVQLSATPNQQPMVDENSMSVNEIECQGQVMIDHLSRDPVGVVSHERFQLASLTINKQTGAISGLGPGVIRSTRFGEQG